MNGGLLDLSGASLQSLKGVCGFSQFVVAKDTGNYQKTLIVEAFDLRPGERTVTEIVYLISQLVCPVLLAYRQELY